ncbi:MAG TPA: META domain-containing protein [Erwinia persicina]|uniref:META domain-containing protein n=1 Tax=Erwinia persicina TaxID=55211 RepID=A0A3S7S4E1_9GAMM|nr:META domain-containing protein [Erwinia persicina]AXU95428.1 META domain-containing protein [Erwinia persicina]MBC3945949.1 META domain-containing protein [Erwinia persicina]MBD8105374.1 META domain-containing protein [Erwinia persicina]MBD8208520.1 META domain-containing protein [Erwinia persicina]MCQ4092157.1 META domain-containing protein [Erwinia persicina]
MKKIILLLAGALALNGCSNAQTTADAPDAARLANRLFTLSAVDGKAVTPHQGMKPGIGFAEDLKVSGVMCNRFFGQGKLEQGRLSVPQLASTRMMCSDPQLNQWEQTLSTVLTRGAEVRLSGMTLTLSGSGHTLEYQAQ